jgi:aminoglycoside phosphotransferase (APT) family kinase protein
VGIDASDLDYEGIWETRSGCKIATVHARGADKNARWVVFKEGRIRKVHEEKVALERWNELAPGIPPKVYGYHEHGYHASILLEYLEGTTFQKLLLQADPLAYQRAFPMMIATLRGVWEQTLEPGVPAKADFAKQLRKRLPDIYKVHPDFAGASTRIGGVKQPGLDELVAAVEPLDAELTAPFQVLIHGDFNNDNLLVDEGRQIVHFIDLHRSRPSDWLQDVTVFLVSNFRMPAREANLRARIDAVNLEFRRFAAGFAADHGDRTWQARMALGLARSFVTSTRFELDPEFSKKMYLRAVYLLERLLDHVGQPWEAFTVPDDVLVD